MKHSIKVTIFLVIFFLLAQIIGLAIINNYIDYNASKQSGKIIFSNLPYDLERPPIENKTSSAAYILAAVIIGTVLILLLAKFKKPVWWKVWFFLAVIFALGIAFSAFINPLLALGIALILAYFKVFKPNFIIHNLTELFVYGGIAVIFVPVMNLTAAFILLLVISIYDAYAVWKSKHMIKLAKFQSKSKVFAGFLIPYKPAKLSSEKMVKESKLKTAILGGGDVAFPLLFAGVVLQDLLLNNSINIAFLKTLIIPFCVSIALLVLLIKAEKNKFYPAMPFLSIGCLVGWLIILFV